MDMMKVLQNANANANAPYISSPLKYICNKSLRSGTFPTHLKYSIVKPLFKKGNRENMVNYRLIY
jgi:hypothetical protein